MEQKPHKKDELMLANNVLKLAEDLIKVRTQLELYLKHMLQILMILKMFLNLLMV